MTFLEPGLTPNQGPIGIAPRRTPTLEKAVGKTALTEPSIVESAFGLHNDVVAAFDLISRPTFPDDPEFDTDRLLEVIGPGSMYEQEHLERFVGARSEASTRAIMARIDQENRYRKKLNDSGFLGTVASMGAGVSSPLTLVPVAGYLNAASRGGRMAVRAAEVGGISAATVAVQEGILQAAQETRTGLESAFAIGGALVIGAVLGTASGAFTREGLDELARRARSDIPGSLDDEARMFDRSLGAASTDSGRGSGELAGALGAEKAVSFQDPLLRLQTSPLQEARNAVRDLAETPLSLAENSEGIATTIGGAVETQIKMAHAPLAEALSEVDSAFSRYFFGKDVRFAALRAGFNRLTGRSTKMTYAEFKEAVYDALLAGDVHAVPEVVAAARALRSRVLDPLKDDAILLRLFPEDVKPLDDIGYVPRSYNTRIIAARRAEFVSILARHFEARQAEALERVADLEARTGAAEAKANAAPDLSPAEIRSLADEVTDTILGHSPERMLTPADLVAGPRGPLKERVLRIPTTLIRDFVERDVEVLARMYTRTMAADIGLVRKFGSTDLRDQIAKINDEANAKAAAAPSEKARNQIDAARKKAIRDLSAIRDRIRGTYAIPNNPDGLIVRAGRLVRNLNYLRLLGGMTLSAVPDIGRPVMVHGLTRTLRTAFVPLVTGLRTFKLAAKEAKLAGTALDMVLDSRVMAIADVMDDYGRGSRVERAVSGATKKFGVVSLMAPWNAGMKQFVGVIGQTRMLQAIEKVVAGKATAKEVEYLAAGGIDANMAERIAHQFQPNGVKDGPVWWANTEAWTDRQAVASFRAMLVRDIDRIIITPGMDKPLWMSTELGKIVGQFRSFNIASVQRTMLAGLQQRDAAALNGALMMLGLGAVSYWLKMEAAGYEVSDDPAKWAVEAFDRSGLAGWFMDGNNLAEKVTRGRVGASALTGEMASRYASRNAFGALLGPSFDLMADAISVSGNAFAGEWTASDLHAMRKLVPLQNIFYLRSLFDSAERGMAGAFGIPLRKN